MVLMDNVANEHVVDHRSSIYLKKHTMFQTFFSWLRVNSKPWQSIHFKKAQRAKIMKKIFVYPITAL